MTVLPTGCWCRAIDIQPIIKLLVDETIFNLYSKNVQKYFETED